MLMKTKYLHAPWHDTKSELPDGSGRRCVCFLPMFGCEVEMIFHRSRKDSGYKDFFTECVGGRAYDYDFIRYWRYYTDPEQEHASEETKERIRKWVVDVLKKIMSTSEANLDKILDRATEYQLKECGAEEGILTALMTEAARPFLFIKEDSSWRKSYSVEQFTKMMKQ